MTDANIVVLFAILVLIVILILDIRNKSSNHMGRSLIRKHTTGDDWHISGSIDGFIQDKFEISFADYWTVGRPVELWLKDVSIDGFDIAAKDQLKITIFPTGEGFDSDCFGRCFISENYDQCVMHINFQIVRHILEDLRISHARHLDLWGKKNKNLNGAVTNFFMT